MLDRCSVYHLTHANSCVHLYGRCSDDVTTFVELTIRKFLDAQKVFICILSSCTVSAYCVLPHEIVVMHIDTDSICAYYAYIVWKSL